MRWAAWPGRWAWKCCSKCTDADELARRQHAEAVDLIGVNNRNLHDFSLTLDTSMALASKPFRASL